MDSLIVVVGDIRTGFLKRELCEGLRPDEGLAVGFFTTSTSNVDVCFPRSSAALARLELFDPNGRRVRKTPLGKRYGTRIFTHDGLPSAGGLRAMPLRPEVANTPNNFVLPKACDLFRIRQTGQFRLTIQLQVFRVQPGGGQSQLVRFGPFDVPIYVTELPPRRHWAWVPAAGRVALGLTLVATGGYAYLRLYRACGPVRTRRIVYAILGGAYLILILWLAYVVLLRPA